MDRILVEVDDISAKIWRDASVEEKSGLNNTISRIIKKAFDKKEDFGEFLFRVSKIAEANGLTEEILNELLNDD